MTIAKTASKEIGALLRSVKILSPEIACMEYCCHIWSGASSCYLELLDKLEK